MPSFKVKEHPLSKKAYERFLEKGLPKAKDEAFQYVPLAKLVGDRVVDEHKEEYGRDFDCILGEDAGEILSHDLPMEILALPLARKKFASHIDRQYAEYIDREDACPLNLLNLASIYEGHFLYLKESPTRPIKIGIKAAQKYQKWMVFVEKGVEAEFIVTMLGDAPRCHTWIDWTLQIGSNIKALLIDDRETKGVHLFHINGRVRKDARFEMGILSSGGFLKRYHFDALIEGEGAHVELKEFAVGSKSSEIHLYSKVRHKVGNSSSHQLSKHLLFEHSKMSFTGKIHIDAESQLSNAYQLSNTLLASPFAIAHSKPGLEVFADDVKASHGATIFSIDEELLFYLLSRGLSPKEALECLIRSFPKELLETFGETIARKWSERVGLLCSTR